MEGEAILVKRIVVLGGGLGGLSAAVRLAAAGCRVTVLEQQNAVGGKLQRIVRGPYRFDRGPSTITMPHAFARVFASAGRRMDDYLVFRRLETGARNWFADGHSVDLSADASAMEAQIAAYSPEDARSYRAFLKESQRLFTLADRHFMNRLLASWQAKLDVTLLAALMQARPLTTLSQLLRRYFKHPHTLAMFGRYATYVGSDPRQSPAIFAMLAHVESQLGVYAVEGGTYAIAEAFAQLATELGATIRTGVRATRIVVRAGRVTGVETTQGEEPADIVVANGDVLSVCGELLNERDRPQMTDARIAGYEPSLSGFVHLLGVRRAYPQLAHHTVFFPEAYGTEFEDIFRRRVAPRTPAIYVCHAGASDPGVAPEGASSLFILANAPYTSEAWSWDERKAAYRDMLLRRLGEYGLALAAEHADVSESYTPDQLRRDTSAYRGAIYGISSNGAKQTFWRPVNCLGPRGLWFAGGTTHPGGGTPMVTLSGQLVAEAILSE